MKKLLFIILVALSPSIRISSQTLADGFYRVNNYVTEHYLFVRDCTGSIDASSITADVDAIEAWKKDNSLYGDPSSIVFLEKSGSNYDIKGQNTGVYEMIGQTLAINESTYGYTVSFTFFYLYDIGTDESNPGSDYNGDRTYVGIGNAGTMPGKTNYRLWNVVPVNSSTDNYFGFKPTVKANGKYYAPFFADFAYTPVNSNLKTYYVSKVDKKVKAAVISEITGQVAASQPVIIACIGSDTSDNKVDISKTGGSAASSNLLEGTYFCNGERSNLSHTGDPAIVPFDATTMRVLGTADGKLAFVGTTGNYGENLVYKTYYQNGSQTTGLCIAHNTAYLTVDSDCPETLTVMTEAEYEIASSIAEASSIEEVRSSAICSLSGVKVSEMQKNRIYIVNGKKFFNK